MKQIWRLPLAARRELWAAAGYKPSPEQLQAHIDPHRLKDVAGGERAGKSYWTAHEIATWLVLADRTDLFWLVGPDYELCRPEFNHLIEGYTNIGLLDSRSIQTPANGQWIMRTTGGAKIETKTSADIKKLAGVAPSGIAMTEAAQQEYEAFLRCRGRVAQKRGPLILSGCLVGETLIPTSEGIVKIGELVGKITRPIDISVCGLAAKSQAKIAFYNGATETRKVTLTKGFEIEGTPNHKIIARGRDGSITWVALDDLTPTHRVAVRYGADLWGDKAIENPYFVGLFIAEGCCSKEDRITITTTEPETEKLLDSMGFYKQRDSCHWRKTDHALATYLRSIGVDTNKRASEKEVPDGILRARREDVIQFLRGLFDGDGTVTRTVSLATSSLVMARQVMSILLNLGLSCSLTRRICKLTYKGVTKEHPAYNIFLSRAREYAEIVGFGLERKQSKALVNKDCAWLRGQAACGSELIGYPVMWLNVVGVEKGFAETYDLHVPEGNSYIANGFISHNTFETSRGWYPQLFWQWQTDNPDGGKSFSLPTWSNLALFPGGREDPEIKALEATLPPDLFMERYGAKPCPPTNLVLREFDPEVHVKDCPFDKSKPAQIWIDPGYSGAYAVLAVQIYGKEVWIIDEVYKQGWVVHDVIDECKLRPWWDNVTHGVIDIAGRQHHGMESQVEVWMNYGDKRLYSQTVPIIAGIERHRTFLRDPASGVPLLFHDPKCVNTIKEYGLYSYPKSKERQNQVELPIDQYNHCVVGDTLIDMPGGKRRIVELVGQTPYVYCCIDGQARVRRAYNIQKTRESAEVVKILMDRGELRLTADHLVMLSDGSYLEAGKLAPGQSLMALNRYVLNDGYTRVCMTNQTKHTRSEHRLVYTEVYGAIPNRSEVHHRDGNCWNHHPDNLELLTMEEHASRHHLGKEISQEQRDAISLKSRERWDKDHERLAAIVRVNVVEAHRANIGRTPWNKRDVGGNHRVIAVIPDGREDVYDMNVEDAHNFVANDIVIHNSVKAIAYGLVANFGVVERPALGGVDIRFMRG